MEIVLKRFYRKDEVLDGILKIGDEVICETSENEATAVAEGAYPLTMVHCRQYDRPMPVLGQEPLEMLEGHEYSDVLTRCDLCRVRDGGAGANTVLPIRCPMLKMGNGVIGRTDGSICVGKHPRDEFGRVLHGVLLHSTATLEKVMERVGKASQITLKVC